ncbi:MAG: DsrE family protein [Bacteroidetes bacterium]|nr:DsrE family protein [Bacteroidota bacterium]
MTLKNILLTFSICLTTILTAYAQTSSTCGDAKAVTQIGRSNLAIVIHSNDTETVWNAFRLANFAASQKDTVKIFLLGKGVEAQNLTSENFDVRRQMESFVAAGGQILACGTCLKLRHTEGNALCPVSTMAELYALIKQSQKVITF